MDRGEGNSTSRWVILGEDGRPLGAVEVPGHVRPAWSRGDAFWAVDTDEMGVPWLVRYRMRGM
jgi:hypothetical protein